MRFGPGAVASQPPQLCMRECLRIAGARTYRGKPDRNVVTSDAKFTSDAKLGRVGGDPDARRRPVGRECNLPSQCEQTPAFNPRSDMVATESETPPSVQNKCKKYTILVRSESLLATMAAWERAGIQASQ